MTERGAFEGYWDWLKAGMIAKTEFQDRGMELWQITNDGTASAEAEWSKWESFKRDDATLMSLTKRAHEMGWKGSIPKTAAAIFEGVANMVSPSIVPGQLPPCPVPLPGTVSPMPRGGSIVGPRGEVLPMDADDSLALDFAGEHVGELRHCEEWGKWLRWAGARWQTDKTARAYNLVRQHLRKIGGGMHLQDARKILSAKTVAAVERMAKTDPRIATEAAIWDADPWLLNTPGGVIDLRTCVIRECRPDDHMTKSTAVAAGGDCPTWKAFLHKSLAGDVEVIGFVQRMLGYALTGDTREQVLFFLYGQGGNGKGVLLNTVAGILADYAKTAPMATFTDSANAGDRHPTDLAGLRGARFVMASETEKGRKWAEAKIKSLTGGDPIAARFMGRDFFEYIPTFKLVIAGNHKPRLSTVDEAIRRRMNMIPFTVQIPEHERDKALPEKLKAEWGGILQWMVEGCLAWQRSGLQPPAAVRAATEEYLTGQDAMATWLDERCEQTPDAWAGRTGLFASWSAWAISAREPIGNAGEFYEALTGKGFPEHKRDGTRGFRGVRLRQFTMPAVP
jgi:putative DNA primase/helicase